MLDRVWKERLMGTLIACTFCDSVLRIIRTLSDFSSAQMASVFGAGMDSPQCIPESRLLARNVAASTLVFLLFCERQACLRRVLAPAFPREARILVPVLLGESATVSSPFQVSERLSSNTSTANGANGDNTLHRLGTHVCMCALDNGVGRSFFSAVHQ